MGRLTKDPDVRATATADVAKYTLAVDRKGQDKGTDYINVTAFGKAANFADKYFFKGQRVLVAGHIQTGSYTGKNGEKVYTTEVIADEQEFADSKRQEEAYSEW